jgi:uncharacterized protein YceK
MLWFTLSLPVLSGCGTIVNFREEHDPKVQLDDLALPQSIYGGVRIDGGVLSQAFTTPFDHPDAPFPAVEVVERVPLFVLCIADMPLSAAADTLTLPFTIYASSMRSQHQDGGAKTPTEK